MSHLEEVSELLKERLQKDFELFNEEDVENLFRKGFRSINAFQQATMQMLKAGPGPEVPLLLIHKVLKAFNPQELLQQPGMFLPPLPLRRSQVCHK